MKKIVRRSLIGFGSISTLAVVVFFIGVAWPLAVPGPNERVERLLIANVHVVDVEAGVVLEGHDILVVDGAIVETGPDLPRDNATVYDGRGHYAIPGMFDMHTHSLKLSPAFTHPLFVAAGITAIRDMGGCIGIKDSWVACREDKRAWDDAVNAGRMVGPRYDHLVGLQINGGDEIPSTLDPSLGAPTPLAARQRVELDKRRGLDFLKPYTQLSRDSYFALAASAQEHGLYLAGHQPLALSALEVISAGQRSIEHAVLFVFDCYPGMDRLREMADIRAVYTTELRQTMIDQHDPALCTEIREQMVQAETAFVPTHTTRKMDAFALDRDYRNDARLRYVPGPLRMMWGQDADAMAERAGEGGQESMRAFYEFGLQQTGLAHQAGVTVLVGTDAPDSFVFPGTSVHDELDHLVLAGMSPLDALRSATLDPAIFLGLEDVTGAIKVGARADLVLLDANPLDDIRAVRAIGAVVLAGVVYDRVDLDGILRTVERNAGSWSMWPKFVWRMLRSPIMRRQFAD